MAIPRHGVLKLLRQLCLGFGEQIPYFFIGGVSLQLYLGQLYFFGTGSDTRPPRALFFLCHPGVAFCYPFDRLFEPFGPIPTDRGSAQIPGPSFQKLGFTVLIAQQGDVKELGLVVGRGMEAPDLDG